MQRIVILGGGFAGITVARRLERRLHAGEAELTLISRENFSVFTPLLPEVSSGALDVRHVVTPIRSQLHKTRFILADVDAVDAVAKTVKFTHTLTGLSESIGYDQLVLALGAATSTFGLPGVAERVFALKTLEDAGILRNRFMWLLELADSESDAAMRQRLLTIVVVGGGFTGVETAGELADLFRDVERFYPNVQRNDVRIILVEGGKSLLPGLPPKMGTYSASALAKRGVEIVTGDPVSRADDDGLQLESGKKLESATIVWSAGVRPSPTLASTPFPRVKGRSILVDADLRVPGYPGVWALGDCAAIPDGKGGFIPMTAQHAIREAPVAADNIIAVLRARPTRAFRYATLGMMASLGGRRAVAQFLGDHVLTGFLAWFLWRTYYLLRLPGLDRKLRVAFDWTLELLFPRDISELRVYSSRAQSSAAADAGLVPPEPSARL